jgi:GRAM domain-containing protein 4
VIDVVAFLAQHLKSGPGIITLTSSTFTFTPAIIGTSSPRIVVPLQDLRAVKKTGALSVKGLALRRINERGEEVAERFLWVRGRDEAFARLVGVTDKRWMRI